ncbi:Gag-Pol polyprotein [Nosema granulosis]|uniref:Gag-Pol polyprotein n=1 Tax=Nosema granulosis TaxID=83296 RepID=A0A9P6GXV0_9MICR|nr:Gag-Pol polyprotein [Nosema granulosis]
MNATDELTWAYIYNACEGLDCSNRVNTTNRGIINESSEICKVSREVRCYKCNARGHLQKDCYSKRRFQKTQVREIEIAERSRMSKMKINLLWRARDDPMPQATPMSFLNGNYDYM